MILFKRAGDLKRWLEQQRALGQSIGFVPTLGALHAGHISLIDISKKRAGVTVCSIFVNPTQFNDPKDFQKYPITLEKDIALLEAAGTDVLLLPEVADVYPGGTKGLETYELGRLETILEGKYRPGHFQGVCQVMRRLLDLVQPDHLFMGRKDYQQCMVIQRLLDIRGMKTELHRCPIFREADGLAMSSRNMRLTAEERGRATAIYRALMAIREGVMEVAVPGGAGETVAARGKELVSALTGKAREILEKADFRVDYVEVADAETLEPMVDGEAVALIAAFQGEVRLIDNMTL